MPKNKDRKLIGSNYNYVVNNIRKYCELLFEFRMHRPNLTSGTDPGFPEGRQPIIRLSFPVNCMKMKEIGPRVGCTSKILLCRSPLYVEKPLHSGIAVADLRGGRKGRAPPPPPAQILSISCIFWENLAKLYVGAPPSGSWRPLLGEILDPPLHRMCSQKRQYVRHFDFFCKTCSHDLYFIRH